MVITLYHNCNLNELCDNYAFDNKYDAIFINLQMSVIIANLPVLYVYLYHLLWKGICQFESYGNVCAYYMHMYISMQCISPDPLKLLFDKANRMVDDVNCI